ncbi:hypothetical protein WG622_12720 [Cognatishimia sp. D5M38]|uniref:Uncharacterized protein n=1 Tax=Cognatishimia coralii TaxID=3083254 RepID=A0ABU8QI69_9RHOB
MISNWSSWEIVPREHQAGLLSQLRKELGAEHSLFRKGSEVQIYARDTASDDVLVIKNNNLGWVVHLTWSDCGDDPDNFTAAELVPELELAFLTEKLSI